MIGILLLILGCDRAQAPQPPDQTPAQADHPRGDEAIAAAAAIARSVAEGPAAFDEALLREGLSAEALEELLYQIASRETRTQDFLRATSAQ